MAVSMTFERHEKKEQRHLQYSLKEQSTTEDCWKVFATFYKRIVGHVSLLRGMNFSWVLYKVTYGDRPGYHSWQ